MKKGIHPKYNENIKAICACGHIFETGSTLEEIKVDICSNCHPFYTGKQKLVDTARRVEKFHAKVQAQKGASQIRKGKKAKRIVQAKKRASKEVEVKAIPEKEKNTKKK